MSSALKWKGRGRAGTLGRHDDSFLGPQYAATSCLCPVSSVLSSRHFRRPSPYPSPLFRFHMGRRGTWRAHPHSRVRLSRTSLPANLPHGMLALSLRRAQPVPLRQGHLSRMAADVGGLRRPQAAASPACAAKAHLAGRLFPPSGTAASPAVPPSQAFPGKKGTKTYRYNMLFLLIFF